MRWRRTPDVRAWWGHAEAGVDEDDLANPHIAQWIVSYDGRPFAFIQDYDPHTWPGHHFGDLPSGSRGIDQFIGEPGMLGLGHGSAFIRAHADRLLKAGAPAIGTDPHPRNTRAIRAYEKARFVQGEVRQTAWSLSLLMYRRAGDVSKAVDSASSEQGRG
jgi:aminoglycoside 6'-N-acetyltransferase